jgi:O-antigen/teichoic acid export membrane protein
LIVPKRSSIRVTLRDWLAEEALGAYAMVVGAYGVLYLTSYIYAVFIARRLGPSNYSALASLLAFGTIVSIGIGGPLQSIIARYVAADTAVGLESRARYLVRKALMVVALVSGAVFVLMLALSWPVMHWLSLTTLTPVVLLALYTGLWLIYPVMAGNVQGVQKFRRLSVALVVAALARLILGIALVLLGFGVSGAMVGEVASGVVVLAILGDWVWRWLRAGPAHGKIDTTHLKMFAATVIVSSTCLVAFIYLDVFLVRGLIGGLQAGYYAGAQKLGTLIYFVPGIIGIVMFPRVSANHASDISSWRTFALTEGAIVVICGCMAAFLALFPTWSIRVVFGSKYVRGSSLVPIFALAMFFFSLLPVCIHFLQATDKRRFVFILMSGVVVETIAIAIFHRSITQVAWIVAVTAMVMFVSMGVYMLADFIGYRKTHPRPADDSGVLAA